MRGSSEWKNSKGHAVMVSKNMFDSMYRCLDSGCGSINQTTTADEEEGGVPMADAATDGAAARAASPAVAGCGFDIRNAEEALAQARKEANAFAESTRSKFARRKLGGKRKANIFRSRTSLEDGEVGGPDDVLAPDDPGSRERVSSPVPTGGLCAVNLGDVGIRRRFPAFLCFANPIHDSASEDGDQSLQGNGAEDDIDQNTLGEDTISSNIYFDSKFRNIVESRPPMPLYRAYRVECTETKTDELTRIVKNDSHKSIPAFASVFSASARKSGSASAAVKSTANGNSSQSSSIRKASHDQRPSAMPVRGCIPVDSSVDSSSDSSVVTAPEGEPATPRTADPTTPITSCPTTDLECHMAKNVAPVTPITPGQDSLESRESRGEKKKQHRGQPSVPELLQTPTGQQTGFAKNGAANVTLFRANGMGS